MFLFIKKTFFILIIILTEVYGIDISSEELLKPTSSIYDITVEDPSKIQSMQMVEKILVEISMLGGDTPRKSVLANCGKSGCPIDAQKCNVVSEIAECPSSSILNSETDKCSAETEPGCLPNLTLETIMSPIVRTTCSAPTSCPSGTNLPSDCSGNYPNTWLKSLYTNELS